MPLVFQLMMGVSLAACAGLRAWLPLLGVGLAAHFGLVPVNPSFAFLGRTDFLVICGIATVLELLGDKVPVVDHFLDSVGTVVRPVAGTLLAASVVTDTDPVMATLLGVILGGGTAFTLNAGKAALRLKSTALAPLHGGTANAALSIGEDVLSLIGIGLSIWLPVVAFVCVLLGLVVSVLTIRAVLRHGKRIFGWGAAKEERGTPVGKP